MTKIKVDSLTRRYGERIAVDDISFEVDSNSIHGLLGPNGAGKTTTLKMICGLLAKSNGQILFDGQSLDQNTNSFKQLFGALIEEPHLYKEMKVYDYLKFLCELYKVPKNEIKKRIEINLGRLELIDVGHRLIGNLSKGFKQRVGIAGCLIHDPKILILDEPTTGLDVEARANMRGIIKSLKKDHTIIITSHILHEMEDLCDAVSLMDNGKVILTERTSSLLEDEETIVIKVKSDENKNLEDIKNRLTGFSINSIGKEKKSLEQIFFENIRGSK